MNILILFFIQFIICFGVQVPLLPDPAQLPPMQNIDTQNIPALNNIINTILNRFSYLSLPNEPYEKIFKLNCPKNEPIVAQYEWLDQIRGILNENLNLIKEELEAPYLQLALNNLQYHQNNTDRNVLLQNNPNLLGLWNKNICLQNLIISSMNFITDIVKLRTSQNELQNKNQVSKNDLKALEESWNQIFNQFYMKINELLDLFKNKGFLRNTNIKEQVNSDLGFLFVNEKNSLKKFIKLFQNKRGGGRGESSSYGGYGRGNK
ncbi:hypothetical protein Mgra_00003424 [Meloidogyne graminicola]|uniref:Secreted protein n=1 Tax=Meloidogyne graminicola TaxID=189291 RepID=A0A8S9ZU45_9BILA|nr:hypothetical protein Mgra_00003424 [Meloidogyne graminicola]